MDAFNKVHIVEPMRSQIYEPNINLISLIILMFNYAKPRIYLFKHTSVEFLLFANIFYVFHAKHKRISCVCVLNNFT